MKISTVPLCAALALALAAATAPAQQFDIQPASADLVAGEALTLRISGLAPNAVVGVVATRVLRDALSGQRRGYVAQARFSADGNGSVDLASAAPLPGGSYAGADPRGLFWSMRPDPAAAVAADADGDQIRFEARVADKPVATRILRLRSAAAALQWRDATPFPGARLAWLPGPPAKRPAIIALGGSEGGASVARSAALLASHGWAVLGLPYYSPSGFGPTGPTPPELPALPGAFAGIAVDRIEQARAWLAAQPEVDASRIALYGVSKGAEFALLAATKMPWVTSVVAIVPSDVVWEGWGPGVDAGKRSSFAWRGSDLPFVPYRDFDKELLGFQTGAPVLIRRPQDAGRAANPGRVPAARIPVETYAGPVLVAGSHDDQVWDSGGMTDAIAASRAAVPGRETVALVFRDAGHALSGTGWSPTTQSNAGPMKMGGNPQADAAAQARVFTATLDFLRRTLR